MDSVWRKAEKYVVIVKETYEIEIFIPLGYCPPFLIGRLTIEEEANSRSWNFGQWTICDGAQCPSRTDIS